MLDSSFAAASERDQLLAEIWCGEGTEQNVPEKVEGELEHPPSLKASANVLDFGATR